MFLPTVILGLGGFSTTQAQLLSVPPYAAACVVTVLVGWAADRTGKRGIFNIGTSLVGIIGFAILLGSNNAALSYFAVFLGALGIYPCIPNTVTWLSNNVEGVYKRGVTLGFVIGKSSEFAPPMEGDYFTNSTGCRLGEPQRGHVIECVSRKR